MTPIISVSTAGFCLVFPDLILKPGNSRLRAWRSLRAPPSAIGQRDARAARGSSSWTSNERRIRCYDRTNLQNGTRIGRRGRRADDLARDE